jgi:hypothetical protein
VVVVRVLKPSEIKVSYPNWAEILDETGWWFNNGEIVVVAQEDKLEELKTILHEVFEFYLERYFEFSHETAHQLALTLEKSAENIWRTYYELSNIIRKVLEKVEVNRSLYSKNSGSIRTQD